MEARFNQARAHAGDCIGSVAAQSLGEPTTQVRGGVEWCVVWCGVVWCGVVWYGGVVLWQQRVRVDQCVPQGVAGVR